VAEEAAVTEVAAVEDTRARATTIATEEDVEGAV